MKCSIVVPVYFNEGSLLPTVEQLKAEVFSARPDIDFEIVFVDDGSGDNSLKELLAIRESSDLKVRIVEFTRNFGQVSAILAGYGFSKGDIIVNISADLQDPPGLINEMIRSHLEEGCEIVICSREEREESRYRKATSRFFYSLMRRLSFPNMPPGGFDFVLISRKVRDLLLKMDEANPFWQGQILWTGFEPKFIPYTRRKRAAGVSRWTFGSKMKYLLDGLLAYSYFPLRVMSALGILLFLLGTLYAGVIVVNYLLGATPFTGWAPLMILILVLSGIQMLMLGVIGEYLWRTLEQVKHREKFVVRRIYE